MVSESNYNHDWTFSHAVSIFISDNSDDLIQTLFEKLSSNGGQVMVPLDDYKGITDLVKNSDGVRTNMGFHGNFYLLNN